MTRRTRRVGWMSARIGRTVVCGLAAVVVAHLASAAATPQVVRAGNGTVACVVTAAPDGPHGERQLAVQVRAPGSPGTEVMTSLPPELRDFSNLPIRLVLLSPPTASTPIQRLPVSFDATLEHPVIDGTPSVDGFVRAIFPCDWVVAGATILGERLVVAPDGTKVTSQTRCAITANDAAHWR